MVPAPATGAVVVVTQDPMIRGKQSPAGESPQAPGPAAGLPGDRLGREHSPAAHHLPRVRSVSRGLRTRQGTSLPPGRSCHICELGREPCRFPSGNDSECFANLNLGECEGGGHGSQPVVTGIVVAALQGPWVRAHFLPPSPKSSKGDIAFSPEGWVTGDQASMVTSTQASIAYVALVRAPHPDGNFRPDPGGGCRP